MASLREPSSRQRLVRSARIGAPLDRNATFVHITDPKTGTEARGAQLADISDSGMRLISRAPVTSRIGDVIQVEFTLAGSSVNVKSQARVVRQTDEFVFAVRFLSRGEKLRAALKEHLAFRRRGFLVKGAGRALTWIAAHRQGLLMTMAGLLLIGATAAYVVMHSDEYLKRNMRPWGDDIPQDYYWDYVKHFPKF